MKQTGQELGDAVVQKFSNFDRSCKICKQYCILLHLLDSPLGLCLWVPLGTCPPECPDALAYSIQMKVFGSAIAYGAQDRQSLGN